MRSRTRREFVRFTLAAGAGALVGAGCIRRGAEEEPGEVATPKPMRILILGGTGFLGPHIVEAARGRGHTMTLFNRGKTNPGLFPDLETILGDRDGELEALEGRSWDAVVDTSGYVPRIVKMSADLLEPSVGQYVFISTISVYADLSREGIDESAPLEQVPDPTSEEVRKHYGGLKALSERAAEAAMPGRVTVVRPGLIVGPGDPTDRFTYWPVRIARGGEVAAPGDGTDPVQIVDVRDLAAFVVRTIETKATGTFNATGPERRFEMREMLEACREAAGSDARFVWIDADFLESKGVAAWSDMPAWLPARGDTAGFGLVECRKAIAAGLAFRPARATAADTLAWWATLSEERRGTLRAGLSAEREAELLEAWRTR